MDEVPIAGAGVRHPWDPHNDEAGLIGARSCGWVSPLVESAGVKVVVDPKSALYVTGSELDYSDALTDGGFKVKNPNAATSCSCGESFSA